MLSINGFGEVPIIIILWKAQDAACLRRFNECGHAGGRGKQRQEVGRPHGIPH